MASGSTPAAALCCAPYDSRLLGSARPELGAALGIYGAPYSAAAAAQSYPGYLPYSPEPPGLYGALVSTRGALYFPHVSLVTCFLAGSLLCLSILQLPFSPFPLQVSTSSRIKPHGKEMGHVLSTLLAS